MKPLLFPDEAQFWYEALRSFGHITYGGADGWTTRCGTGPRSASSPTGPADSR